MKTRSSWGIVYVAAFFALLVVGVTYGTYSYERAQRIAKVTAVTGTFGDWQPISDVAALAAAATTTLSGKVSSDLYAGYSQLLNQGQFTAAERDRMLADIAKNNVSSPDVVPNISLTDLSVGTTSVSSYLTTLTVILAQSQNVKEYEPTVFARVVNGSNADATTLANDAALYQKIAAAILMTEVPPALASQHLEVVKSVGALAKAVGNMATWNGDPIEALVAIDTFNKTEAYVKNSVNNLLAAAEKLKT